MIQESFLHFIWKYQYFDKENLVYQQNERINILHPGFHNFNAGPDFLNARIFIGDIQWNGHVEIHIKSSDWHLHQHDHDKNYDNVILHVVWINDKLIYRSDGTIIPTIELKDVTDISLINNYQQLINYPDAIPCSSQIDQAEKITLLSMFDRTLMKRMEKKSRWINELLQYNQNDWESTTYQLICNNFGFKVNNDPFLQLSKSVPYRIILKHFDHPHQVEALLFGQAGFLDDELDDPYFRKMQNEYRFLNRKYNLRENKMEKFQWKFLRLRPFNFPTIRIAQLARLLTQHRNLFSFFRECIDIKQLRIFLDVKQSDYWLKHYYFGKKFKSPVKGLGKSSVDNLIINTIAPMLISYGQNVDIQKFVDQGVDLLHKIPPENNKIVNKWKTLNINPKSAFDSQAMIELYNEFCKKRKCIYCNIGTFLLRQSLVNS